MNPVSIMAIAEKVADQVVKLFSFGECRRYPEYGRDRIMEMRGYEVAQKYVRYRLYRETEKKIKIRPYDGILSLLDNINEELNQENSK